MGQVWLVEPNKGVTVKIDEKALDDHITGPSEPLVNMWPAR